MSEFLHSFSVNSFIYLHQGENLTSVLVYSILNSNKYIIPGVDILL